MLIGIAVCALFVALTVSGHAAGLALVFRLFTNWHVPQNLESGSKTWALVRVTWLLVIIHAIEITLWALLYLWEGCLQTLESAFYFSGVTYTTIGYGDIVLPDKWRILGPIEGLTGILMSGLSASLFFAIVAKLYVTGFSAPSTNETDSRRATGVKAP
jgi:voltage-gated potassium channel